MTNVIGQILMVLAVNTTTNTAQFTKYAAEAAVLSNGVELSVGQTWAATAQTTNAPVAVTTETRIGTTTKDGGTQYLFSVYSTKSVDNGLRSGDGWFCAEIYMSGCSGIAVNMEDKR